MNLQRKIIPAILSDSIEDIQTKISTASQFCDLVQIDIMDGAFVPERSISLQDLFNIDFNSVKIEIHLMVNNPFKFFDLCETLGAFRVIVHFEAVNDFDDFSFFENYSFQKFIALNPETGVNVLSNKILNYFDGVMFLGVVPGAQGRPFDFSVLDKIDELRSFYSGLISLDGGIKLDNFPKILEHKINFFVIGSALFKNNFEENYKQFLHILKNY